MGGHHTRTHCTVRRPAAVWLLANKREPQRTTVNINYLLMCMVGCAIATIEHREALGWIAPQQASAARLFKRACNLAAQSYTPSSGWLRDFVDQSIDPASTRLYEGMHMTTKKPRKPPAEAKPPKSGRTQPTRGAGRPAWGAELSDQSYCSSTATCKRSTPPKPPKTRGMRRRPHTVAPLDEALRIIASEPIFWAGY